MTAPGGTVGTLPKFAAGSSIIDSADYDTNNLVSMQNLANILFADRFTHGVPDAIAACPANGCTIYAGSPNVESEPGNHRSGNESHHHLSRPVHLHINQIVVAEGFENYRHGRLGRQNGTVSCSVVTLQRYQSAIRQRKQPGSCSAAGKQFVGHERFAFGVSDSWDRPATAAKTESFSIPVRLVNSGLWYSTVSDVYLEGFAGIGILLKGPNNNLGATASGFILTTS